jgi:hypothetical protein
MRIHTGNSLILRTHFLPESPQYYQTREPLLQENAQSPVFLLNIPVQDLQLFSEKKGDPDQQDPSRQQNDRLRKPR